MRKYFFLPLLLICHLSIAQIFTEAMPSAPFENIKNGGSMDHADVDNDGDLDVLITGYNGSTRISKLYKNDGNGTFSEVTGTPFQAIQYGEIVFGDIDNDNDQDVIINGFPGGNTSYAILYSNDGNGNFTEITGTSLLGTTVGSTDFADIDGDSDLDLLITGESFIPGVIFTKLYTNDGSGNFTEVSGISIENMLESDAEFADIDGDGDLDLLIVGYDENYDFKTNLYTNDGTGNFTLIMGTSIKQIAFGSVSFGDVDSDGDQDFVIAGFNATAFHAFLYTNDGNGNFTEMTGTPFAGVLASSSEFADVDNDGDLDIIISGRSAADGKITTLYTNDGAGNFVEDMSSTLVPVEYGDIAFLDVDNDNDQDLIIIGETIDSLPVSKLYYNQSISTSIEPINFQDQSDQSIPIFPNPFFNKLTIERADFSQEKILISIFNMEGKNVMTDIWEKDEAYKILDLDSLTAGIYFIHLADGQSVIRKKISKN